MIVLMMGGMIGPMVGGGGLVGGGLVAGGLVGGGLVGGGTVGGGLVGGALVGGTFDGGGLTGGGLVGSGSLGRFVMVGGMRVRVGVGEAVGVLDGVMVGEDVGVREGIGVTEEVGELVAVVKRVANAWIVSCLSTLQVAVGEPRPVFGIMRSGSTIVWLAEPTIQNGRANVIPQVARIII